MAGIGVGWAVLAGIYLVLAGSLTGHEIGAAILCGALGAVWVHRVGRCRDHHLTIRTAALAPLLPALAKLPGETARVGLRLMRAVLRGDVVGMERAVPPAQASHCPLDGDSLEAAGARAVVVLATSLSPDTYVLRLERESRRVQVHAILPADARA